MSENRSLLELTEKIGKIDGLLDSIRQQTEGQWRQLREAQELAAKNDARLHDLENEVEKLRAQCGSPKTEKNDEGFRILNLLLDNWRIVGLAIAALGAALGLWKLDSVVALFTFGVVPDQAE